MVTESTGTPLDIVVSSYVSVPMTPSASGTTAASGSSGTGGLVTPLSGSFHSDGDELDLELESRAHATSTQPFNTAPAVAQATAKVQPPRTLIDLPVDVLKEIVKEVHNTNDLVALSLTCRCLHVLSTPHIYSRFDIVWPDSDALGDRPGVDALTYGLATLVASGRRGNDYARWIRKFSLGNGPSEWVDEYNVSKESGKMLGTLINLALMRMENLETFNWDMPTGILRDIFMTLHDLCPQSLRNVHVRFHDNSETTIPASQDPSRRVETPTFKGFKALRQLSVLDIDERKYLEEMSYAVEESVDTLRELRLGLAQHVTKMGHWIWDLDETEHADTPITSPGGSAVGGALGILVSRICDLPERKRKLRADVNIAAATTSTPATTVQTMAQVGTAVLAAPVAPVATQSTGIVVDGLASYIADHNIDVQVLAADLLTASTQQIGEDQAFDVSALVNALPLSEQASPTQTSVTLGPNNSTTQLTTTLPTIVKPETPPAVADPLKQNPADEEEKPVRQLKLETLDLERVPISVRVLQKAIDWSCLTNLTILNCPNHERLWKALRRRGSPHAPSSTSNQAYMKTGYVPYHGTQAQKNARRSTTSVNPADYKIRLKKLHTDLVSPSLILFIKEALAPNSLEVLFLQEKPTLLGSPTSFSSPVTMDNIFRYCIKRHRLSLRKLLVDSSVDSQGQGYEGDKWRFNRDVLGFITTYGNMPNLRELGCAIDYQDWHFFLTRLPGLCGLRSLYIPHVKGAVQVQQAVSKEMALQVLDVVSLRNEVEMCYVGVITKCFELLEGRDEDGLGDMGDGINLDEEVDGGDDGQDEDETSEDDAGDGFDPLAEEEGGAVEGFGDEDFDLLAAFTASNGANVAGTLGSANDPKDEDSEGDDGGGGKGGYAREADKVKVRLREILFYDDKVAIFKARNGKL